MNKALEFILAGCALVMVGILLFATAVAFNLITPVYGNCYQSIEGKTCPLIRYEIGGK